MVRYGIIGAGMMGQEHIRNIALLEDARVTAFSDPDPNMSAASEGLSGGQRFVHHQELIDSGLCDALVIAAPNHLHLPILRDVLKSDLPVLCEKPMGITVAECQEIEALCAGRAAPMWIAMEYRYMPPVQRLIEEVRKGTAGEIKMMAIREHRFPFLHKVGDWNRFNAQTGGTLVEKCCHFFDLMRLVLQAEPVRVYASGAADINHADESYDGRRPDILDNAYVVVDFDGGQRAMLDLCMFAEGSEWQEVISVTGPKARIDAKVPGPARFSPNGQERKSRIVISDRATKRPVWEDIEVDGRILHAGDHHGSTFYQHQRFQQVVLGNAQPEVTVRDGLIAVAVGAAAEESVRTGQAITLPNFHMKGAA
ncbi:putative dehydrogenase [Rubricella aquisinus]|uniref:Putative dehydrogenase n=1 Tax=Rubricella aquisinus TaxID=2028108 RepID=A0A840WMA0_9RHOB|nr:Gfo/Idh/MocA family oxidoreductase [Rubricella aquisinus]MBB5515243.1 putative dehydrogenase [Rubricella aquisinus]